MFLLFRSILGGPSELRGGKVGTVRCAWTISPWTDHAKRAALWLSLLGLLGVCKAELSGWPAQEGIINFGKVNDNLYRGAHPDTASLKNLKRLGIKTIVNLDRKSTRLNSSHLGISY